MQKIQSKTKKLLGEKLRLIRTIRGLSQRDLTALSGVPDYKISQLEHGYIQPRPNEAIQLARALGVKVSLLLDADETASLEAIVRTAVAP